MLLIEAVILGIVRSVTEFLPLSYEGHMALFYSLTGLGPQEVAFGALFDVVVHMGMLFAVIAAIRRDLWGLIRRPLRVENAALLVASAPVVIGVIFLREWAGILMGDVVFVVMGFLGTGFLLIYSDYVNHLDLKKNMRDLDFVDSLFMGAFQGVGLLFGMGRTGVGAAAALFRKLNRGDAGRFVVLLTAPAILTTIIMSIAQGGLLPGGPALNANAALSLAFGFLSALLTGYLVINILMALIETARLRYIAFYLFAMAVFAGVDTFLLHGRFFGIQA